MSSDNVAEVYFRIRQQTEKICAPLEVEDYVVQPVVDISPPKWHLGHSTWFFETFLLKEFLPGYQEFHPDYNYVFNSYYETVGARVLRTDRGNLSRPSVQDIYRYRQHVDKAMEQLLSGDTKKFHDTLLLGLNHEQQHQELLLTDIKYILGHNPLFPAYSNDPIEKSKNVDTGDYVKIVAGLYDIGFNGSGFCFDNELQRHKVYLDDFSVARSLVTNSQYLEFIEQGGYSDFRYWHSEGWDWVQREKIKAPLYWHFMDGSWKRYSLSGLEEVAPEEAVTHVSFYEAAAYAAFIGERLPTEFEWEAANTQFKWGERWEWTNSAYLPYPGFAKPQGAIGEYNGKFMVNQMVLRGSSIATPAGHSRPTYRNFFHAPLRWQFTGIRLCKQA